MIFSNTQIKPVEREYEFGKIWQIQLGEYGRARKLLALTCPEGCAIKQGANPDYTIGSTKSGRPRIVKEADPTVYLLLSSYGYYCRNSVGRVFSAKATAENILVLGTGNGAEGIAGSVGSWDVRLLKVVNGTEAIIRVRHTGKDPLSEVIRVVNGHPHIVRQSEYLTMCDELVIDPLVTINDEDTVVPDEWVTV